MTIIGRRIEFCLDESGSGLTEYALVVGVFALPSIVTTAFVVGD